MSSQFDRTKLIIGEDGVETLKSKHVVVFGIGGVGGHTIEALARAGIGQLTIVDKDVVDITNLNRQIIALQSSVGKAKTRAMKERIMDINPKCVVNEKNIFFLPDTANEFDFTQYDYVIDAIDNVTGKLEIISKCKEYNIPVISSMGTGNKMRPEQLCIEDIHKTSVCPLAKVIRKELKKRHIKDVKVVYSKEEPKKNRPPGSMPYVPGVAGMIMASEVVNTFVKGE